MNVTFACPECEVTSRLPLESGQAISCPYCVWVSANPVSANHLSDNLVSAHPVDANNLESLDRCSVCACQDLFVRKNFSQRLGVTIVVMACIGSAITWGFHMRYATYGILFAAALLDLALYFLVGNLLQCYRCHAEYRGLPGLEQHEPFSLETHERYRQQAIRLKESQTSNVKG